MVVQMAGFTLWHSVLAPHFTPHSLMRSLSLVEAGGAVVENADICYSFMHSLCAYFVQLKARRVENVIPLLKMPSVLIILPREYKRIQISKVSMVSCVFATELSLFVKWPFFGNAETL